jgi:hypothetical protein
LRDEFERCAWGLCARLLSGRGKELAKALGSWVSEYFCGRALLVDLALMEEKDA